MARAIFVTEAIHALSLQIAERIGADPLGGENLLSEADLAETRRELREDVDVQQALFEFWPVLTPRQVLRDLLSDADRLASAAGDLTDERARAAAARPRGRLDAGRRAAARRAGRTARRRRHAAGRGQRPASGARRSSTPRACWRSSKGSRSLDFEDEAEEEVLSAIDVVDASAFVERHEVIDTRTAAERAATDRTWVFGHVIVDEAQELSPMAWRLLMRRCPSRSMTVVGDVAQTSELSGTTSWERSSSRTSGSAGGWSS